MTLESLLLQRYPMSSLAVAALASVAAAVSPGRDYSGAAAASVPFPNYRHEGVWSSHQLTSSPIWFKNKLYLVSSRIGHAHSFFCVFDGATGQNISCPESSYDHFFFSSIVDHTRGEENQTVWVFGSAWNRANRTSHGGSWGSGPCEDASRGVGPGCYVGAWSSQDMTTWQFSEAVTFPVPQTTANPGASMVPISSQPTPAGHLARHQAFMALEGGPLAINTGEDGNLHQSWKLLSPSYTGAPGPRPRDPKQPEAARSGGFGMPCPSARYNPLDR